jgi:hypothetical protein
MCKEGCPVDSNRERLSGPGCCGGRCGARSEPISLSRREFIEVVVAGAAGLALVGDLAFGKAEEVRALLTIPKQSARHYPLAPPPMASLEYEGGYPIARLTFRDPVLPVEMLLEAFNGWPWR